MARRPSCAVGDGSGTPAFWGPSVAPVVVKLGDRGQHELTLWLTVPIPLTYVSGYSTFPMGTIGYSFMF